MSRSMRYRVVVLLALLLGIAGCFSSRFVLGPEASARTSRIYVGDWRFENNGGAGISIRNFDDKSYVVLITSKNSDGTESTEFYRGFTADVKDVTFAHLKKLNADGTPDDKWALYRIAVTDGGELILRGLSEDYFKGKKIESDDDLQKIVEAGIDDEKMYKTSTLTGKKVK